MFKSNNTLISTVMSHRTTSDKVEFALYGEGGKEKFVAFKAAAYNFSVNESEETRNAAFEAGRAVLALYNDALPEGRRVKFDGMEDLYTFARLAVKRSAVKSARVKALEVYKALALYRQGLKDSASFTGKDYTNACKLVDYKPTPKERAGYALPAEVCVQIVSAVNEEISALKEAHTNAAREDCEVSLATFAKDIEVIVAGKIDRVMNKTAEELEAEKKAKNAARRAAREKVKKAEAKAAKESEKKAA